MSFADPSNSPADQSRASHQQGLALAQAGRYEEAAAWFRYALQLQPDNALAHENLARACNQQGIALAGARRFAEAETWFREAARLRPDGIDFHSNLAKMLQAQGKLTEAVTVYERVLQLKPGDIEAHNALGGLLMRLGRYADARQHYQRWVELTPDSAEAHNYLGTAFQELSGFPEAQEEYQKAVELQPQWAGAQFNLGHILAMQGKHAEAMPYYARALQLDPNLAEAHFCLALALLKTGDFERGWQEFAWRDRHPNWPRPRLFTQPPWDRSALHGRTILLYAEPGSGFGDTINFIRYAQPIKELGGRVIAEVPETLRALCSTCPAVEEVYAQGSPLPQVDTHAILTGLPAILRTDFATIPRNVPYLFADPQLKQRWQEKLRTVEGLKVGICWHGKPRRAPFDARPIPLERLAPLARLSGVALCSLQKGAGSEELAETAGRLSVIDLGTSFTDFADTAAALANLDLIITIDTSIAHCAGALGLPVWVLLSYVCDWRWFLDREDSPWYPTMRLFRQKRPGDWEEVIDRVVQAIESRSS
jgi:Flp pilus assembly protein TadD